MIFASFTLYFACGRVGRGSLVLKHSTFRRILEALCVDLQSSTAAFSFDTRAQSKETKILNISSLRVGIETTVYHGYRVWHRFVPQRHDWPHIVVVCLIYQ